MSKYISHNKVQLTGQLEFYQKENSLLHIRTIKNGRKADRIGASVS